MKQNPDSYLLYESGKFITFNYRRKVIMRHAVDGSALVRAAQLAFRRFPYYAKELHILPNGEIELRQNDRPLFVGQTKHEHVRLGTAEVNYHLCSIDYEDNVIYFNMYHGLCGGCGATFWVKSTLWHYVQEAFGVTLEKGDIKTADTPLTDAEMAFPDPAALTEGEPIGKVKKDRVYIPAAGYIKHAIMLREAKYHELELDARDFMKYARSNDGSPNSILAALMFKAVCKVTSPRIAKAFRAHVVCNYRADVGCPETYHDLVRLMSVFYPRNLEKKSTEFLSTITRSMMYLQMQPEYSIKAFLYDCKCKEGVDMRKGFTRKRLYAMTHSPYVRPPYSTFMISYVGKSDWYGLEDYIERMHSITDGHLLLEVASLRDRFFLSFMDLDADHKYYNAFCDAMREEGIHFTEHGCFDRMLPHSVLSKKEHPPA